MARFRNSSGEPLFIPAATPQHVEPDGLFEVPDEMAAATEASPHFTPVAEKKGDR